MEIDVYIEHQNKNVKINLEKNSTIAILLKKLKLNPVEMVVSKNNEVVTEDTKIKEKEKIKIFSVVSGG